MAFDLTCLTTFQPNFIASISSLLAGAESHFVLKFGHVYRIRILHQEPAYHRAHVAAAFGGRFEHFH